MKISEHPWLPPPSDQYIADYAILEGLSKADAEVALLREREDAIAAEREDPLRCGWEPQVWKAADALLGLPCRDEVWEKQCRTRWGIGADEAAAEFRKRLGFGGLVRNLLIMGANRSGKSEYTAKRGVQVLLDRPGRRVMWFHQTMPMSRDHQQPLIYRYLPSDMRREVASAREYVKYKAKTGFSEASFILPNGGTGKFCAYAQDVNDVLQGTEPDAAFPDELVPEDWVQFLKVRVGTRDGFVCTSFTPVDGYTATVKTYCDGMVLVLQSIGFCLPQDGGAPDVARALGLEERELEPLRRCRAEGVAADYPYSRPEDLFGAVLDKGRFDGGDMPDGRSFERVPRIARGFEPNTAIIWFHGRDNPYGNPLRIVDDAVSDKRGREWVQKTVYGVAVKAHGAAFPKWTRDVHVVPDEAVPEKGTNYMFLDPHPARNWFMGWIRSGENEKNWTFREWPGNYEIPGVGVPDVWAKPSGRKNGRNDGDRGGGQTLFGFGLLRMKFEVARLERWHDWRRWRQDNPVEEVPDFDTLLEWSERNGADEAIARRFIDPRAASATSVREEQPKTLMEELEEIGLEFVQAPGTGVTGGLDLVANALDYNERAPIGYMNSPRHYCAASCINSIFAFENYQNVEGDKGAMKEPVDVHRWFYVARCEYVPASETRLPWQAAAMAGREADRRAGRHPQIVAGGRLGAAGFARDGWRPVRARF